jgi:RHS repeat-associated protein
LTNRTGDCFVIFGYNGRDGVVTDENGFLYMRARYYAPVLSRFVNADIIAGEISNAITLNRYAYVNGNPVSSVDPFGLSSKRGSDIGHTILDIGGMLPGLGMLFDATNAIQRFTIALTSLLKLLIKTVIKHISPTILKEML